jgi:GNAT superfamily N-acetyltransferase
MAGAQIREIHEDELVRWVAASNGALPIPGTVEEFLDWKRQAGETVWLLASDGTDDVGVAIGVGGWHEPPGVARMELGVVREARGHGVGSALLASLGPWGAALGYRELVGSVQAADAASLAWTERRGFFEVGRNTRLVLDLAGLEAPEGAPPAGIEIVTWAERPELARGIYTVACEAYADVPDAEDDEAMPSFEEWLSIDMQGASDRPEATFVALAGSEVVGYAKLHLSPALPDVGSHDMTGVLRAWRRRGIAGALKRAEIAWAKQNGFTKLRTAPEERNEASRQLNERYGYLPEPGEVIVRGPIPSVAA